MYSVGERLKRARLDQGLELSVVAARTKIARSFLEAIESDDRKKLPSGFFYKSFVDQYARILSLDTTEIDAEIDQMLTGDAPLPLPGQDGNPIYRDPPIVIRSRFRKTRALASFATLILVLLGCSEIYGWWRNGRLPLDLAWFQDFDKSIQIVEVRQPEPSGAAALMVPAQAAPQSSLQAAAPASSVTPAIEARAVDSGTRAADSATPAGDSSARSSDSKVLLDLIAREKTWLSASSDGRPVFSGLLLAHETKTIQGKQTARLRIGNAAGLEVRLNGKALGPLGARGQVLVVLFTPDNFEIMAPTKEGD